MAIAARATTALDAVVLAAGAGSRFGGGKLLAPWRGGTVLDAALAAAFAAPVRSVSVVWGADARVSAAAQAFAARIGAEKRLRLIHAPGHAEGMAESLKAAIAGLSHESEGVFVFLGDMPRIPPAVAAGLAEAFAAGALAAAPSFRGRRGHPVLFSAALYPRLAALSGDAGAASALTEIGPRLVLVPALDDGVLFDIDRRGDIKA